MGSPVGHVVIVEDDNDIGFLLSNVIGRQDWLDAIHIPTVETAMDEIIWLEKKNVIGIIDLNLGGSTTGIDIARWVHEHVSKNIPMLGITASSQHSPIYQEAQKSGLFFAVEVKPVPHLKLFSLIREGLYGES